MNRPQPYTRFLWANLLTLGQRQPLLQSVAPVKATAAAAAAVCCKPPQRPVTTVARRSSQRPSYQQSASLTSPDDDPSLRYTRAPSYQSVEEVDDDAADAGAEADDDNVRTIEGSAIDTDEMEEMRHQQWLSDAQRQQHQSTALQQRHSDELTDDQQLDALFDRLNTKELDSQSGIESLLSPYINPERMLEQRYNETQLAEHGITTEQRQLVDEFAREMVTLAQQPTNQSLIVDKHSPYSPLYIELLQLQQLPTSIDQFFTPHRHKNLHNFNKLLRVHAVKQMYVEGLEVFDLMKQSGITPNVNTYTALMQLVVCDLQTTPSVQSATAPSKELTAIQTKSLRLTELRRYEKLLQLYSDAKQKVNSEVNEVFFGALLNSLVTLHYTKQAYDILKHDLPTHIKPNEVMYTTLISGSRRDNDIATAWQTFDLMKANGVQPDAITYNTVIRLCAEQQETEKAVKLMTEMRHAGHLPSLFTYTNLIYACSKRVDWYVQAFKYYEQVLAEGFVPNVVMMNTLLHVAAAQGDVNNAIEIYKQMKQHRVERDVISYSTMFRTIAKSMKQAYVKVNGVDIGIEKRLIMADRLYDQMLGQGIKLTNRCFYNYINCYCRAMRLRRAETKVDELLNAHSHLYADIHLHLAMLRMYGRARRLSDVERWMQRMTEDSVLPTHAVYMTLLQLCVKLRLGDKGASILSDMRSSGYEPPEDIAKLFDAGLLARLTLADSQEKSKRLSYWNPLRGDPMLETYKNKRGAGRRAAKHNVSPERYKTQSYKKMLDEYYEPKQRAKHGY